MKRRIWLTTSLVIPTLALLPMSFVSCAKANVTCSNKSVSTDAGSRTANFVCTLAKATNEKITVATENVSGSNVSISSKISGTTITIIATITIGDEYTSCSSSFDLKFSCNSWSETIKGFKLTYTPTPAPVDIPTENLAISGTGVLSGLTGTVPSTCTRLTVPSTVKEISANAFNGKLSLSNGLNIKTIVVPKTVTKVGDLAFANNSGVNILDMSSWTSTPTWTGKNIFKGWTTTKGTIKPVSGDNRTLVLDYLYDKLPGSWTNDEYMETYIADRTFSIGAFGTGGSCFGTGWILSDATSATNDYTYWVATNWHVAHGFEQVKAASSQYYFTYADKNFSDETTGIINYSNYNLMSYTQPTTNDFIYSDYEQSTYLKSAIDFQIAKITFGNSSSPTGTPKEAIKTKLDKLNAKQSREGSITNFTEVGESIESKATWIGGYPYKENEGKTLQGGKWETHKINASAYLDFDINYEFAPSLVGNPEKGHPIGYPNYDQTGAYQGNIYEQYGYTPEDFYYYDISPQHLFEYSEETDWMSGGASGSMLVNEDYNVAAIYWGGITGQDEKGELGFFPSFSMIRTSYKDFVSPYLDKKI